MSSVNWAVFNQLRKVFMGSLEGAKQAVRSLSLFAGISEGAARRHLEGGRRWKNGHGLCRRPPAYGPTFRYRRSRTAK